MKKNLSVGVLSLSLLLSATLGSSASAATPSVTGVQNVVKSTVGTASNVVKTLAGKFKDVPSNFWAASSINLAVAQGYFKGYADGTFKPNAPITKAEMAAILSRITTQPNVSTAQPNFTDIPAWASDGVRGAVQKGFINPSDYNGKLNANAELTRGELAKWLANGLAGANPDYGTALRDVTNTVIPAKEYFTGKLPANQKNGVAVTLGTGLMTVGSDKLFGTDRTTTRAEAAALIARYVAISRKNPDDFQGLKELRAVGLTGTNIKVVASSYVKMPAEKIPGSDYSKVTDDFSQIRNKELKTVTNYADVKIKNFIIVNPYAKGDKRSIYYPVFLDEGDTLLNGSYFAFTEYDMVLRGDMNQLQAGSLINSPTINPAISPRSMSTKDYGVPKLSDITGPRGVFLVKTANYWGRGLLHFAPNLTVTITLSTKDGLTYYVINN